MKFFDEKKLGFGKIKYSVGKCYWKLWNVSRFRLKVLKYMNCYYKIIIMLKVKIIKVLFFIVIKFDGVLLYFKRRN